MTWEYAAAAYALVGAATALTSSRAERQYTHARWMRADTNIERAFCDAPLAALFLFGTISYLGYLVFWPLHLRRRYAARRFAKRVQAGIDPIWPRR